MKTMNKSAVPFFSSYRRTFLMLGAVICMAASGLMAESTNPQGRVIRASRVSAPAGVQSQVTVPIQLASSGNEASISFSLNFDPQVLTNPVVALGGGVPTGSILETNTDSVAQGQLGVLVHSTNTLAAGIRIVITVTFTVPASAQTGIYEVTFGGVPTPQRVSSLTGELFPTTYAPGYVVVGVVASIRATSASLPGGGFERQLRTSILLDSQGNEASTSFSLNFNPFVFTNPFVTLGNGVPAGSTLEINTNNATQGQLGILVNSTNTYAAGIRNIVNITFTVPASASIGGHVITFGSVPTPQSVLSATGVLLPATYEQGSVSIGTANGIPISGRVLTPDGRGIANATVVIYDGTDGYGNFRIATTNSLGYYSFSQVGSGGTYMMTVRSKRYRFAPRVFQFGGVLTVFDFVGLE